MKKKKKWLEDASLSPAVLLYSSSLFIRLLWADSKTREKLASGKKGFLFAPFSFTDALNLMCLFFPSFAEGKIRPVLSVVEVSA